MWSLLKPRSLWRLSKAALLVILFTLAFVQIFQQWMKIKSNRNDKVEEYAEKVQLEKLQKELNQDHIETKNDNLAHPVSIQL